VSDKYSRTFGGDNCKECSKHRIIGKIDWSPELKQDFEKQLQKIAEDMKNTKKCKFCGELFIPESGSYGLECKEGGAHVNYKGKSLEELKNGV
jgi:hypothetical protein